MSAHRLYVIVFYISFASAFVPALIGIFKFGKLSRLTRILFFYTCLACAVEVGCAVYPIGEAIASLQNIFALAELIVLFYFFYLLLRNRTLQTLILATLAALLVQFGYFFFKNGVTAPNNCFSTLECICLVVLSATLYLRVFLNLRRALLTPNYIVLVNTAIFTYFLSSLVLLLFDEVITETSKSVFENLWSLHLVTNIGFNTLLGLGLWKQTNFKRQ